MPKNIVVYKKTDCPWAAEVEKYLNDKGIKYEARDILTNAEWKEEVESATGQSKSPTLNMDGVWVKDAGVEDVEKALADFKSKE